VTTSKVVVSCSSCLQEDDDDTILIKLFEEYKYQYDQVESTKRCLYLGIFASEHTHIIDLFFTLVLQFGFASNIVWLRLFSFIDCIVWSGLVWFGILNGKNGLTHLCA